MAYLPPPLGGWIPTDANAAVASATPVTEAVAMAEYPGYYQKLFHASAAKSTTWYLLVAKSVDGGKNFTDFVAYKQDSVDQPLFPAVFNAGWGIWPWVGVGAGAALLLLVVFGRKGKRNRG